MLKYLLALMAIYSQLFSESIETPVYIIYRESPGAGFWSNFMVVLSGIDTADTHQWIPVIDMQRHPTHYNNQEKIKGILNSWEYYFEQPGNLSLHDALKHKSVYTNKGKGVFSFARTIHPLEEKLKRAKELIAKYIRVKEHIQNEIDSIIPPGIHDNILGVHIRGTDRRQGAPNHLMTAEAEEYLKKAIEIDDEYRFNKIFIACDEIETVDLFRQEFGDRLIVTNAYRVSNQVNTHEGGYGWLFDAPRKNHRYLLGKEVCIDALLLARCGHLICGPSNVAHAAIYFAEAKQQIHEVASPGFYLPAL